MIPQSTAHSPTVRPSDRQTPLGSRHPCLRALGFIRLALKLALSNRHQSEGILLEMAEKAASDSRDVHAENARDAEHGRFLLRELLADGHASEADVRQLDLHFAEIHTQATEGRVIRT
jgi:hypothetical protein